MVPVESVFQNVLSLSRKGSTGYSSSAEFNAQQRLVQDMLLGWYADRFEKDQSVLDSLLPFIKEPVLACATGVVALPADYYRRLQCQFGYTSGGSVAYFPCLYLAANEEASTNDSFVRKPSADKRRFYHTMGGDNIKVLPNINGVMKLKYISLPPDAVRGFIIDTTNVVENYDAGSSTDFLWGPDDEVNLVDLFLFLKGISTRQSELLTWVAQKRQLTT